jgi:hypothetical protein
MTASPKPYARAEIAPQIAAIPAPRPVNPAVLSPARRRLEEAQRRAEAAAQGLTPAEAGDLRAQLAGVQASLTETQRQVKVLLELLRPADEADEETVPPMARPALYVVRESNTG